MKTFKKFIPFAKVDATKREVWGIVTAELPDKEKEVCDYNKSKPFYEAVIAEMGKASNNKNFFPLREMHQLSAVGKCVGFEFRDEEKEIFMGFKVVDDDAWKKVDEGVYTGFSQGGRMVGELLPDPVFKGCMRYVANPSEVSVVDNPCLGAAHFAYVKADGSVEMRKLRSSDEQEEEVPQSSGFSMSRVQTLEKELERYKAIEKERHDRVFAYIRKQLRIKVNRSVKKLNASAINLDDQLGRLQKGMGEVSALATLVQQLSWMCYRVCDEQAWEGDSESELPASIVSNANSLIDTLIAMCAEETSELRNELSTLVSQ